LSKPKYGVLMRLLSVIALAAGLNLAWATWAQAAGNVEVREENGDAIITGDDGDNNIILIQDVGGSGGVLGVTGRAETTVNGRAGRFDVGVTHDVIIKMKGGNDFVRVDSSSPLRNGLKINTGEGDDIIELLGVTVLA